MVVESLSRLKINSDRLLHYSQVHFKNALMSFIDEKKMRCKICHEVNKGGKKKFFSIGRLLLHVGTQHNKLKELLPNEEKHLLRKGRVFKERGYNVAQKDIDPICEEKTDEDLFCKFCVGVYTNTKYQLYRHYSGKKVNSGRILFPLSSGIHYQTDLQRFVGENQTCTICQDGRSRRDIVRHLGKTGNHKISVVPSFVSSIFIQ